MHLWRRSLILFSLPIIILSNWLLPLNRHSGWRILLVWFLMPERWKWPWLNWIYKVTIWIGGSKRYAPILLAMKMISIRLSYNLTRKLVGYLSIRKSVLLSCPICWWTPLNTARLSRLFGWRQNWRKTGSTFGFPFPIKVSDWRMSIRTSYSYDSIREIPSREVVALACHILKYLSNCTKVKSGLITIQTKGLRSISNCRCRRPLPGTFRRTMPIWMSCFRHNRLSI